ncbi:hypothetical protein ACE1CA_15765 [Aerosakkonemataceae cyanobacterium BLCC-F167]|uniref:Uncharacterized protein n=1 Tax=Floridaenema evergladense BLCC-F167 TaxID=3153639 RepID=A0ABV4WLM1_9CYAN
MNAEVVCKQFTDWLIFKSLLQIRGGCSAVAAALLRYIFSNDLVMTWMRAYGTITQTESTETAEALAR